MTAQVAIKKSNYIEERVKKFGSLEKYLISISNSTARNYKKIIEDYIENNQNTTDEEKDAFKKALRDKLEHSDLEELSVNIDKIFNEIEVNSATHNSIIIKDDYNFLLTVLLINISNKEKSELFVKDINLLSDAPIFEIKILSGAKREFIVIEKKETFKKLFTSISKNDVDSQLFKTKDFSSIIELQFSRVGVHKKFDKNLFKKQVLTKYISEIL